MLCWEVALIYTKVQIDQYLSRIKYTDPVELNGMTLQRLQIAHLKNIPYENLDILNQVPLALDAESLFNKMVVRPRGGYCFELNGLYSNLLKSLGFAVVNLAGRFIDRDESLQMRRHRILKVKTTHGTYICDVGVRSESPRRALEFTHAVVQDDGVSEYKFEPDDFYGHVLWQKERGKDWKKCYGFTEEPQLDIDYVMPSFFCEKHPQSPFIGFKKISIFTDTSNINILQDDLIFYENATVTKQIPLRNKKAVDDALDRYFGIKVDP
jgi:N-hydroxyarylamine O-acetyltransferase